MCISQGRVRRKNDVGWTRKIGTERHLCSIQDPFLTSHDLGRCVSIDTRDVLLHELAGAADCLYCNAEDPIAALMQPHNGERDRGKSGSGAARGVKTQARPASVHGSRGVGSQKASPSAGGAKGHRSSRANPVDGRLNAQRSPKAGGGRNRRREAGTAMGIAADSSNANK